MTADDPSKGANGGANDAPEGGYHWGARAGAVQIGLRVTPAVAAPGQPVQLTAAVQNLSAAPIFVEPAWVLLLRHGEAVAEHGSGPRPAGPLELSGGELMEAVGWQLGEEQLGRDEGTCIAWVAYRPPGAAEARSAEVQIEVRIDARQR